MMQCAARTMWLTMRSSSATANGYPPQVETASTVEVLDSWVARRRL